MSKTYRVRILEQRVVDYWYEAEDEKDALKKHDEGEVMLCEEDEGDPTEVEVLSIKEDSPNE